MFADFSVEIFSSCRNENVAALLDIILPTKSDVQLGILWGFFCFVFCR